MSEQRSAIAEEAWRLERAGHVTASSAWMIAKRGIKGQPLKCYDDYLAQVLCERITGLPTPSFVSPAMQWGIDNEEAAAAAYEIATGRLVSGSGKEFVKHPSIKWLGASPDRFVEEDGLLEIKCPNTSTHIARLATREIPYEYRIQMQVQLLCTNRRWCDFCDYDPRVTAFNPDAALLIVRYEPSIEELQDLQGKICEFLAEIESKLTTLRTYKSDLT